jgi:hypothetical protein
VFLDVGVGGEVGAVLGAASEEPGAPPARSWNGSWTLDATRTSSNMAAIPEPNASTSALAEYDLGPRRSLLFIFGAIPDAASPSTPSAGCVREARGIDEPPGIAAGVDPPA